MSRRASATLPRSLRKLQTSLALWDIQAVLDVVSHAETEDDWARSGYAGLRIAGLGPRSVPSTTLSDRPERLRNHMFRHLCANASKSLKTARFARTG